MTTDPKMEIQGAVYRYCRRRGLTPDEADLVSDITWDVLQLHLERREPKK